MPRTVLIRFIPPAPIKVKTGKETTHTREWDGEKLAAFLQEGLEIWAGDKHPDFEMRVVVSRQAEIRFENWNPEKKEAEELRAEIGGEIGQVMEGIEPEECCGMHPGTWWCSASGCTWWCTVCAVADGPSKVVLP